MSAPTQTPTDWAAILDSASGSIASNSSSLISSSLGGGISGSSMTSGAVTRKRTLTNFSTHSNSVSGSDAQHLAASSYVVGSSDELASGEASTKSGKSSSAASMRSARSATSKSLSTKEYYDRCKKVADARVEDMVRRHYKFRADEACRVDATRWKLLKAKNHMACYRKVGKSALGQVPDVLATGTVPGALEDVLHGVVNLSTEAMQIENAYAEGDMVDTRTLATLVAPSVREPFRTMTIKWVLRNHEELSRHRDYVYLESTGITTAPDGEQVGYHLMHSVSLPSAPAFTKDTNIIRGQLSACYVFRQQPQNSVEVFYVGNMNPMGNTRERPALVIAVASVLACASSVQCAMMKKLAYSLRTKSPLAAPPPVPVPVTRSRKNTITAFMRSTSAPGSGSGSDEKQACSVCRRNLRFFGKGACELCRGVVCGRCRVGKKLFLFDHGVFNPVKMEFCTECVVTTNALSASWVAARELELASLQDDSYGETSSVVSGPTSSSHRPVHAGGRHHKAYSIESDNSVDEQRYTMVTDYSSGGSGYDRSSCIWMPSDRVLRSNADVLAPIRAEPEEEDDAAHPPPFFADEDEAFPIVEMPSDEEGDDTSSGMRVAGGIGRTNHAVDLVVLYKP